jgi:transcriptional regulator with XRE-family HTH domain
MTSRDRDSRMPRAPNGIDAFVGGRIAWRRAALGLSQAALAQRLNLSFQQVQKYESGANRVSASRLHQIAAVLGAPIAAFFPEPTAEASGEPGNADWLAGLRFMTASAGGRTVARSFPLIEERSVRQAVACIVEALAAR